MASYIPGRRVSRESGERKAEADLANSEVAEAANELGLVEGVGGLLHAAHGGHLRVHLQELVLGHVDLERGCVAVEGVERVLGELDLERVVVRRLLKRLGRVCRGLQAAAERAGRARRL
jgi:hypothetical protein